MKPILLTKKQAEEEKKRSKNLGWPYLPAIYEIPPKRREAKTRKEVIQLIQSRCIHRRMGILTEEGHSFLYCQDCEEKFPNKEI